MNLNLRPLHTFDTSDQAVVGTWEEKAWRRALQPAAPVLSPGVIHGVYPRAHQPERWVSLNKQD